MGVRGAGGRCGRGGQMGEGSGMWVRRRGWMNQCMLLK